MKIPGRDLIPKVDFRSPIEFRNPIEFRKKRPRTGLAPGSIIYTGEIYTEKARVEVIDYNNDEIVELAIVDIADLEKYKNSDSVTWVNVQGLHDVDLIAKIGNIMGLHSLTLEDIVDTHQRPKLEEFDDYMFITLKMLNHDSKTDKIDVEQVSLIMHQNFVICFQEKPKDVLDDARKRLRNGKGKARNRGADYLAYMLLDVIIDYYFETLDSVWEKTEKLEEMVISNPERIELRDIQMLKKDLIQLKKYIVPLKDAIYALTNRDNTIFQDATKIFLRDSNDHIEQVIENLDTYRETLSSVMDLYLSQLSIKMNEVMKVLTLMSTIFIPLTFIAGVYGMNFENMPELGWEYSYPYGFYSLLGIVGIGMFIFMKRRKWL